MTSQQGITGIENPGVAGGRLLSLDLLRGLTIAFMILVNDPGTESASYAPLKHAEWNGFTPTDLVFPTFLLLVGVTTVLSTAARLARGATRRSLLGHAARRAAILFLLGLVVNSFPLFHLHTLRVYGVLPRIAVCYFFAAVVYLVDSGWRSKVAVVVAVLGSYWLLMRFVPVPGFGVPGQNVPLLDPDRNLVAWIDRDLFTPTHLFERTRDPEGLLSTLPALGTVTLGVLTGIWLRTARPLVQKAQGLVAAGVSGVLLGGLWNLSFPINKKLWTSSYVLFAAGWSLLLLALFVWLADMRGRRPAALTPLLVFGTNAIFAYVLSELLAATLDTIHVSRTISLHGWFWHAIGHGIPDAALASLLYALVYTAVCWLVVYPLYRRRIFIRI